MWAYVEILEKRNEKDSEIKIPSYIKKKREAENIIALKKIIRIEYLFWWEVNEQ